MSTPRPALSLAVSGMSCEGCANAVKRLILKHDPQAEVEVHLQAARADIRTDQPLSVFTQALTKAGYPAQAQS